MATAHPQDAIALLKADHKTIGDLFSKYESAQNGEQKARIARQVCQTIIVHTSIEEEIFYPALRSRIDDDLLDAAYVEHDGAKVLIAELMSGAPEDDFFDAKVKVLADEIKHHIHEEEKREVGMFAQARAAKIDLAGLGKRLMSRKQSLMSDIERNGAPPPETRTLRETVRHSAAPM